MRIISILTKDFQQLVLISFIIATPIAYYGINYWLRSFSVRMTLSIWLFIVPLFIIVIITSLTICLHVVKASLANPVESLRSE